jgi:hypothetical protein
LTLLVLVLALVRRDDTDVVDAATAFATLCSKWASGVDGRRALSTEAAISFVLAVAVSPVAAALVDPAVGQALFSVKTLPMSMELDR